MSQDTTSEVQDPAPTAQLGASKRNRVKATLNYQEEMLRLEDRKIDRGDDNDEHLNFFRYETFPSTRKLFLGSEFQNMVENEINAAENN